MYFRTPELHQRLLTNQPRAALFFEQRNFAPLSGQQKARHRTRQPAADRQVASRPAASAQTGFLRATHSRAGFTWKISTSFSPSPAARLSRSHSSCTNDR